MSLTPPNALQLADTSAPHDQWQVVEAAVSNTTGSMRFAAGMYSESRMAINGENGIDVPVVDLFD